MIPLHDRLDSEHQSDTPSSIRPCDSLDDGNAFGPPPQDLYDSSQESFGDNLLPSSSFYTHQLYDVPLNPANDRASCGSGELCEDPDTTQGNPTAFETPQEPHDTENHPTPNTREPGIHNAAAPSPPASPTAQSQHPYGHQDPATPPPGDKRPSANTAAARTPEGGQDHAERGNGARETPAEAPQRSNGHDIPPTGPPSRGGTEAPAPRAEPADAPEEPVPVPPLQSLNGHAPSSEVRSVDGESSLPPFPPEVITKKYVYDTLCEWETQRVARHDALNQLLDPLINGLTVDIQVAKISNDQLWRYVKDRTKLNRENVQRLRSLAGIIAKTEQHYPTRAAGRSPSDGETGRNSGDSKTLGNSTNADKDVRSTTAYAGRLLNILTVPWIAELHNNCLSEADYVETFSEVIESDMVQGKVLKLTEEYEKATGAILARASELRSKLKSQQRDTAKSWQEVQKHFRDTEKAQRKRLDQANTNSQRLRSDVKSSVSPSSTHRDVVESDMDASAGGTVKEHRDTWLAERRYFHTAVAFLQMQRVYFYSVKKAISELAQLETWRTVTLRDALLHYLAAGREALGSTALSLGRVHTAVDADDFQKQKAAFFARTSPATSPTSHRAPAASGETAVAGGKGPPQSNAELANVAPAEGGPGDSVQKPNEPQDPNDVPESTYASTSYRHVLDDAQELVTGGEPPEPRLIIKLGHVKRQTGLFGRWSEGILVLTWDRFLHMFRSHDDVHPLWTVSMTAVELMENQSVDVFLHVPWNPQRINHYSPYIDFTVRVIDEKTGLRTVEIRDKQNLFAVLGQRSFRFRALYETDLSNWLRCLTLASTADDRAFRAEGIAQARASDVSVPLHDYTPWTPQDALEDIPDTQSIESGHLSLPSCGH